jgi:thioesterase domain-containing protein
MNHALRADARPPSEPTLALQAKLLAMPPVRAFDLRVSGYDGCMLELMAPLAANVNDKGSAFGGSLASLMTLAAWGLATLKLGEAGHEADVYVQDSQLRYLYPLYDDLHICARLAPTQEWSTFLSTYHTRGKARVLLTAEARNARGDVVTSFEGRYVALRPGA